ncbi:hypothetical protein C8R47DRAFT_709767 [Mycena vitilis]|nr:hypothetical protein C8R47DRAFT_709767 [Mycena vitilis]
MSMAACSVPKNILFFQPSTMDIAQLLNAETRSNPLRISNLLNPDETPVDVLPVIKQLATFSENRNDVLVPPEIHNHLNAVLNHLEGTHPPSNPSIPQVSAGSAETHARVESREVKLNRETTLDILYTYPVEALVEYPETSAEGFVGHLFKIDPRNWSNPVLDTAYSRGKPAGQTIAGKEVFTRILLESGTNEPVPCVLSHTTCQGSKVCPHSDKDLLALPHVSATRADVKERLQNDRDHRLETSSPSKDVFLRTVGYLAAIQKLGCSRPLSEKTFLLSSEEEERQTRELYLHQIQRGYRMRNGICEGRIVFGNDDSEQPFVCCEHYIPGKSQDHFYDSTIASGAYDVPYIEAVVTGDLEEAARIEDEAGDEGYGPAVECSTVSNFSAQRVFCPVPHRETNGGLVQPVLDHLPCASKFRVYEPLEAYRSSCPYILVVTTGEHTHPVPLPTKTPPRVRAMLMSLLEQMVDDLADLTPRRFIRHPIVKLFLSKECPKIINPTLADWHVSLANRSHLKSYIKQARDLHYPFGTGWAGTYTSRSAACV